MDRQRDGRSTAHNYNYKTSPKCKEKAGRDAAVYETLHGARETGKRDTGHGAREPGHGARETGHGARETGHGPGTSPARPGRTDRRSVGEPARPIHPLPQRADGRAGTHPFTPGLPIAVSPLGRETVYFMEMSFTLFCALSGIAQEVG